MEPEPSVPWWLRKTAMEAIDEYDAIEKRSQGRSIEQMVEDLKQAGWIAVRSTVWLSPRGERYRGPYGAWWAMEAGR
jgi:hypothetical protein